MIFHNKLLQNHLVNPLCLGLLILFVRGHTKALQHKDCSILLSRFSHSTLPCPTPSKGDLLTS